MRVKIKAVTTCGETWNRIWSVPSLQEAANKAEYEAQNWADYHGLSIKTVHVDELDKLDEPIISKIEELAKPYTGLPVGKLAYHGLIDMNFAMNRKEMEVYDESNGIGVGIDHFHKEVFLIPWLTEEDYQANRIAESFMSKFK